MSCSLLKSGGELLTSINPVPSFCRFKPNEGVIIIGATNFPEALDKYVCLCVSRLKMSELTVHIHAQLSLIDSHPEAVFGCSDPDRDTVSDPL